MLKLLVSYLPANNDFIWYTLYKTLVMSGKFLYETLNYDFKKKKYIPKLMAMCLEKNP